jgi:hypothetical protein
MNLVDRAKNIITSPKTEWPVIEVEATTPKELYLNYIVILAAITPIAMLIGSLFHGFFLFFFTLATAIATYLLVLIFAYLYALLANFLAPKFGGIANRTQALKLVAYSATAAWVAGIGHILPFLGTLLVLIGGIYSIYLLYLGAPAMMKVPLERAVAYVATLIIVAIIIGAVVGSLVTAVLVSSMGGGMFAMGGGSTFADRRAADSQAAAIALTAAAIQASAEAQRQAAAANAPAPGPAPAATSNAQVAANPAAALAALTGAGAAAGQTVDPIDKDILKALLPDTVGGLPRTGTEATKGGMANMQISEADGDYSADQKHVKLKVVDMGGAQMLGMAAAWAMVDIDRSSDTGYEKTGKVNGRPTHEKFDKSSGSGEYAVLIAGRFLVDAEGNADMSALKDGVAAVDPAKLESMKDVGVHKTN